MIYLVSKLLNQLVTLPFIQSVGYLVKLLFISLFIRSVRLSRSCSVSWLYNKSFNYSFI